tara:strand:- start:3095 stop:4537 length:1443 start_codon:yes stop_codon:yes gene_type:complete
MNRNQRRQATKQQSKVSASEFLRQGGIAFNQGNLTKALNIFAKGVADNPADHDLKIALSRALAHVEFKSFNPAFKALILKCLKERGLNYQDLSKAWYSILLCDPAFKPVQALIEDKPYSVAALKNCIKDAYFLEGVSKLMIYDMRFEKALVTIAAEASTRAFEKAYASYCEYTESVFLDNPKPSAKIVIDSKINSLGLSDDVVSEKVRGHYEANPYPRWRYIHAQKPLRKALEDTQTYLVAGCGTGFGLCSTALKYPNRDITAFDISRTSLAYAKTKSEELGLKNISFYHADILNLKDLNQKFDIIECSGVLHHMDEVSLGWEALLEKLAPEGKMNIGLYSKTARYDINRARHLIAKSGLKPVHSDIKKAREMIFDLPEDNPARLVLSRHDFYSTSGCRDLLFHEQEIQITIPEIEKILRALNLCFDGFNTLPANIIQKYNTSYPDDPEGVNLKNWHDFELKNPDIFKGMYQFWCSRKQA